MSKGIASFDLARTAEGDRATSRSSSLPSKTRVALPL